MLSERYQTFRWESHLKYLLLFYLLLLLSLLLLLLSLLLVAVVVVVVLVFYYYYYYYYYYYFIVLWHSFLTYIHSRFRRTFFGLSNLEFIFYFYLIFCLFVCFVIYVCVFSTSSGLAEKRIRLPQGLSFVLYLYFRIFYFCIIELWALVNFKYRKKIGVNICTLPEVGGFRLRLMYENTD